MKMKNGGWNKGFAWMLTVALLTAMLCGSAMAEETTLEPWANEGGWVSFPLVVQQEELNGAWEEGAKAFAGAIGLAALEGLDGATLKKMMLQGYAYETHFDDLTVDGTRITVRSQEGEELFSHEYGWVETMENAMEGAAVYVFQAKDEKAGAFTYLCMTEPKTTESENGNYTSFNLFHAAKDYQAMFDKNNVQIPCMMIRADTGTEGLTAAILDIFASPAVIVKP